MCVKIQDEAATTSPMERSSLKAENTLFKAIRSEEEEQNTTKSCGA
jgi:hypothetical protein